MIPLIKHYAHTHHSPRNPLSRGSSSRGAYTACLVWAVRSMGDVAAYQWFLQQVVVVVVEGKEEEKKTSRSLAR